MPDPVDRRASERMPVSADTSCTFAGAVTENFGAVKIQNISLDGIGLLTSSPVEVGALLVVTLVNKSKSFAKNLLVRVAHVTQQRGGHLIGGTLDTPLTYQEMTTLVM
jgi:hypothetical protein